MRSSPPPPVRAADRVSQAALGLLWVFTVVAIAGYATFGRNPELLGRFPDLAGFYAASFGFFAQGHILLAGGALAVFLFRNVGGRWIVALLAIYGISLTAELAGTTTGIPFGPYRYTDALGAKWFGHVPVSIPVSWFFMAVPAYAMAVWALPHRPVRRIVAAAALLTLWDLALDPAMSHATAYWVWEQPGRYYGMPLINLLGWFTTGLALMATLTALGAREWMAGLPHGWLLGFYGANLFLPLGMCAAAGLGSVLLVTAGAVLVLTLALTAAQPVPRMETAA